MGPGETVATCFPLALYRVEAIKRAAYKFSATFACDIAISEAEVSCTLKPVRALSDEEAAQLLNEFTVEVLDQDLRAAIAEETASIRTAILGYAFSRTDLQGE
jgi:His-Xaa-Ser system protein HxsD